MSEQPKIEYDAACLFDDGLFKVQDGKWVRIGDNPNPRYEWRQVSMTVSFSAAEWAKLDPETQALVAREYSQAG